MEDVGISNDNYTIWIKFESGLEGGITTHPEGTHGNPQGDLSTNPVVAGQVAEIFPLL